MKLKPQQQKLPLFLTVDEYAELRCVTKGHAANERSANIGPAYVKIGGRVTYPRDTVLDFIDKHLVNTKDQTVSCGSTRVNNNKRSGQQTVDLTGLPHPAKTTG